DRLDVVVPYANGASRPAIVMGGDAHAGDHDRLAVDRRFDEREPRMRSLRDELALFVDQHEAAIVLDARVADLRAIPCDAARALQRIDVEARDAHDRFLRES